MLVPGEFAKTNQVVPIDRFRNILTVAMLCPLDDAALQSLEETTGLEVRPILCSEDDVRASIHRYYEEGAAAYSGAE